MVNKSLTTAFAAVVSAGVLASPALASHGGGGGGGGTKVVLPPPPIPAATFEGIGSGPVYIHESFGHVQRTRYTRGGSVIDVVDKPEIGGIRAEYPNKKAESWIGTEDGASWRFAVIGPADPFEPLTPLQFSDEFGVQDGDLALVGAEPFGPDPRPAALLPFPAPTDSASTVSADIVDFDGKTAIGFTNSSATARNFETGGQAWLELDATGHFITGGDTGILKWTFHAGATTLTGTYDSPLTGYNQAAVSYDSVAHVAAATVNGKLVGSVPFTAAPISYVGVEGSIFANVDNFTVRAGTVNDPPPAAVAPPAG
jgi:hypothetical protein